MADETSLALIPIRRLTGGEPAIIVPYESQAWLGIARIRKCEIHALPPGGPDEIFDSAWWMQLFRRDVTFWPIDAWSGHIFTLILLELRPSPPFRALRWVWPKPGNLGEVQRIETMWLKQGIAT